MGYTTEYEGHVNVEPPLSLEEYQAFEALNKARHDHHSAPSLYCSWGVSKDGKRISWDGTEKFVGGAEWMTLIVRALAAAGHTCNGTLDAFGESRGDVWRLLVKDNVVSVQQGSVQYGEPVAEQNYAPPALGQMLRLGAG